MKRFEECSCFAPTERATGSNIERQVKLFAENTFLTQLYEAVSESVLILNLNRQIVFCNQNFLKYVKRDAMSIYGRRPGEALGCLHIVDGVGGCGTSEFCGTCGALAALLQGNAGTADVQECRILTGPGEAADFLVRSTPLQVHGENFTIAALLDISHEKRRRALEHIFFHDLMNTVTGLQMLSRSLARSMSDQDSPGIETSIARGIDLLVDEINGQRDLLAAETHDLAVHPIEIAAEDLLEDLRASFSHFADERGCILAIDPGSQPVTFKSDRKILSRVLANMLKNAIEASRQSETVTSGCVQVNGTVRFWVHNDAYIPRKLQLQLFQRSFSTRGAGRGLGTYSMKLLSEHYLKGTVSFITSESAGTTFEARYPLSLERG